MKAARLNAIGQELAVESMVIPALADDEVLIRLQAAALNHRDVWIQKGMYANIQLPCTLGSDGAGIIEAVGSEVDESWLEEEVLINPNQNWGASEKAQSTDYGILGMPSNGTLASYVIVPVDRVHFLPEHLAFEEGAALPLGGLTAYRALFTRGDAQTGDKVLINGIGGGVAQFAFQFALAAGCEVYVSSSKAEKIELAKEKGAKGGFLYTDEKWGKQALKETGGFDVIIDSAGGKGFNDLIAAAAFGARIVTYGGTAGKVPDISPQLIFWKQLSILGSTMGSDLDFSSMLEFVNQHKLVPQIDSIYPLEEVNKAFARVDGGQQIGKVVVSLSEAE